jgi:hypothetical protein
MPNLTIPTLVKHMTVAIYREGKITAKTKKDRFKQCLQIAKSRCSQYGFVAFAGNSLTEAIALTPKGRAAELRHKAEGRAKTVFFDTLYDEFDLDGKRALMEKKTQPAETAAPPPAKPSAVPNASTISRNVPATPAAKKPAKYSKKDLL